jgi:hypothetical protein
MSAFGLKRTAAPLICLLFGVAAGASAQDGRSVPATQLRSSEVFEKADEASAGATKAFEFGLADFSYHVSANGNGRREGGGLVRRFNLRLDDGEEISRVYFSKYAGDLLLVCVVASGEVGRAFVVRLEQPSMRARWKQRVPGDNVAAAREGESLYVAAKGFVGKLSLATGAYLWKHDRLTPDGPPLFESFEQPEVRGDTISFREAAVAGRPAKTLLLNKKTGKLIRIE